MTPLTLVRHGETDWNLDRRIQGSTDIPLNDTGREQARDAAAALRAQLDLDSTPIVVVASDLSRARETAEIIAARAGAARSAALPGAARAQRTARPRASTPRSSSRAGATGTAPRSPAPSRGRTCARRALRALRRRRARRAPRDRAGRGIRHRRHARRPDPRADPARERRRAAARRRAPRATAPRTRCSSSGERHPAPVVRRGRPPRLGGMAAAADGRRVHRGVPARGGRAPAADPGDHRAASADPAPSPRRRSATASPRSCSAAATRCTIAGWKKHIGLYPVPTLHEPLESRDRAVPGREGLGGLPARAAGARTSSSAGSTAAIVAAARPAESGRTARLRAAQHRARVAQHRLVDHPAAVREDAALALGRRAARRAPTPPRLARAGTRRG